MTTKQSEAIKARFKREGKTFAQFAREHGFPLNLVSQVLNGRVLGHYGKGHEIAKALGMK